MVSAVTIANVASLVITDDGVTPLSYKRGVMLILVAYFANICMHLQMNIMYYGGGLHKICYS